MPTNNQDITRQQQSRLGRLIAEFCLLGRLAAHQQPVCWGFYSRVSLRHYANEMLLSEMKFGVTID